MRLALFLLIFTCFSARAYAFFFNSKHAENERALKEIELAYSNNDCAYFEGLYAKFAAGKIAPKLREEAYYYEGRCYENIAADKAISVYKLALELYPKNPIFPYRLALIYNVAGFYDKALMLFEQAIDKHFDEWGVYAGAAAACRQLGRFDKAAEYYKKALSGCGGNNAKLIAELAECLISAARFEEARSIIEKGMELSPKGNWQALKAETFARQGQFKLAAEALGKAEGRKQQLSKAFYLFWAGQTASAGKIADKALLERPNDALAAFLKGIILLSNGQQLAADKFFRISACGGKFMAKLSAKLSAAPLPEQKELCK